MRKFIGIAFSVLFLILAFHKVDFAQLGRVLIGIKLEWLILAVFVYLATFIPRTLRWQRLLQPVKHIKAKAILPVTLVGYMANNVLPLRMGDFFRAHFLKEREEISGSSALATILVERVCDGLTLVLLLAVVLVFSPQKKWVYDLGWAATAVFFTSIMGIVILTRYEGSIRNMSFLSRFKDRSLYKLLTPKFKSFLIGLRGLSSIEDSAVVGINSVLIWLLEGVVLYIIILSFGLSFSLASTALVLVIISFSTMIPSGPGFIGTFQYAFVLSFGLFGINKETAIAVSIVTQLVFFIIVNPLGIGLLWKHNLSLRKALGVVVKLENSSHER